MRSVTPPADHRACWPRDAWCLHARHRPVRHTRLRAARRRSSTQVCRRRGRVRASRRLLGASRGLWARVCPAISVSKRPTCVSRTSGKSRVVSHTRLTDALDGSPTKTCDGSPRAAGCTTVNGAAWRAPSKDSSRPSCRVVPVDLGGVSSRTIRTPLMPSQSATAWRGAGRASTTTMIAAATARGTRQRDASARRGHRCGP